MHVRLLLAGCGKMGSAMLEGWLEKGIQPNDITVVDPNRDVTDNLSHNQRINVASAPYELETTYTPNVIILAVKPQAMNDVLPQYTRFIGPDIVFLSIAAGKTIAYFEKKISSNSAIIRAMPNTPASVRRGITVAFPNNHVSSKQHQTCQGLLESIGTVEWVSEEHQIDIVTALSGGGPAYVFLLVECMARAGVDAGLPADLAMRLARATIVGSGELLHRSTEEVAILRENVTSPGGTTAEALKVLMGEDGWQSIITTAINSATKRSRQLAS